MLLTKWSLFMALSAVLFIIGCSDNSTGSDDDGDKDVYSVIIEPVEVSFDAIGQSKQFTAKAYDENGAQISVGFSWSSSDENVVMIASDGMAEAVGSGNASIYVSAGEKADTAKAAVELPVEASVWWVSATSGDWSDASKWSTGSVPQAGDTVAITLEGDYTVSLTADVTVGYILLGAEGGNQVLATGSHQLTINNGTLTDGGELKTDGTVLFTEMFNWEDGEITGSGVVDVEQSAQLNVYNGGSDSKVKLSATLENNGVFVIASGITIDVNGGTINNNKKFDFESDDVFISLYAGGKFNNTGDIVKSAGPGESSISGSGDDTFVSEGYINIESGALRIRDGKLSNVIDINEGAELIQKGETFIGTPFYNRGSGAFVVEGKITLGEQAGEKFSFNNIVLDSWQTEDGITGPGDLTITNLLWHAGGMSGSGKVLLHGDGGAILEGSGTKKIIERALEVGGSLETGPLLNLTLEEGAQLQINRNAKWTHTGGGYINKGVGDMPKIIINDTFIKNGSGTLVVETDFTCEGTMYLNEDVLTVKGAFELTKTGVITGGTTDTTSELKSRRLILVDAPSAVLAGTIDPDVDGSSAMMSILGKVTIKPDFKLLIDIDPFETVEYESLTFETGGIELAGTLAVNVKNIPTVGARYRVVSTYDAVGTFDAITGTDVFTTVQEDTRGVLLMYH